MAERFAEVKLDVRLGGIAGAWLGDLVPADAVTEVAGDAESAVAVGGGATHLRRGAPDDAAAV